MKTSLKFYEIESQAEGSTFRSRDHLEAESKAEALIEFDRLYYSETGHKGLVTSISEFDSEAAYLGQF